MSGATGEWLAERHDAAIRLWRESADVAKAIGARFELAATLREHAARAGDQALRQRADLLAVTLTAEHADLALDQRSWQGVVMVTPMSSFLS